MSDDRELNELFENIEIVPRSDAKERARERMLKASESMPKASGFAFRQPVSNIERIENRMDKKSTITQAGTNVATLSRSSAAYEASLDAAAPPDDIDDSGMPGGGFDDLDPPVSGGDDSGTPDSNGTDDDSGDPGASGTGGDGDGDDGGNPSASNGDGGGSG